MLEGDVTLVRLCNLPQREEWFVDLVRTVQRAEDVEYRLKAIQLVVTRHKELFPDDNAVYTRVCSELLQTLPLLLEGGAVSEVADASFHSNTSLSNTSFNTTTSFNTSLNNNNTLSE